MSCGEPQLLELWWVHPPTATLGAFATIPAYLADVFGTAFVGGIHGRLLTSSHQRSFEVER